MTRPTRPQRIGCNIVLQILSAFALICCCLITTTTAAPAGNSFGQPLVSADSAWLPWLGCWQLVEEARPSAGPLGNQNRSADRVVVCLVPVAGDPSAVEVTTVADGEPVLVETLTADDTERKVEETSCAGWRRSTWSDDRSRLFTRAKLVCDGEESRSVSGVGLMASATTWLDIQMVDSGGREEVTVRRYRRTSESTPVRATTAPLPTDVLNRAVTAAKLSSTSELGVNDVIEAGLVVDRSVVEAMLIESRASFVLDRRELIRLDNSGVPSEVIDLMVALSFPDEFAVERPPARTASSLNSTGGFVAPFNPYGFNRWYPYYASPFGYYYGWSPYSSLYYLGPAASYVIMPGTPNGGSSGRAYRGRGYSQIEAREPRRDRELEQKTTTTGINNVRTSGRTSSGSIRGTGSRSGARATPRGHTRGGSSGSRRTARPRGR